MWVLYTADLRRANLQGTPNCVVVITRGYGEEQICDACLRWTMWELSQNVMELVGSVDARRAKHQGQRDIISQAWNPVGLP
jgi:hypothetical protein